ncbi:hypothetical protein AB836_00375 [Rickettsiales bacterium (ex Bugula neritina AB1)]|nr:hypothetical protein AB836_00375 [Rickettsiales bacterium (ex Bugula neritina AB1)]
MNTIIKFHREEDIFSLFNLEEICKELLIPEKLLKEYIKIAENLLETKLKFIFQKVIVSYYTNYSTTTLPFLPFMKIISIKNISEEEITKYKINYKNNIIEILEKHDAYIIEYLCGYDLKNFCDNNPIILWIIKNYIKHLVHKKPITNNTITEEALLYIKNKYNILGIK